MASSFIGFKDNGFWARDGFVESFQLLLFEEIQLQYQDQFEWLNNYKKNLALQSLPLIYGGMSMCLDETLTDSNRTAIILELLDDIGKKIVNDNEYLTGTHLNSLRKTVRNYLVDMKEFDWDEKEIEKQLKDGHYGELPFEKYKRGFSLLRALVVGQLNIKADTEITYWGD
ncbi:MAG: hypothetical protein V4722_17885 [Bacteroidota bacterium]